MSSNRTAHDCAAILADEGGLDIRYGVLGHSTDRLESMDRIMRYFAEDLIGQDRVGSVRDEIRAVESLAHGARAEVGAWRSTCRAMRM